mmetsp:Transcript_26041/g.57532  ORF Transcript_26041/g.57532 Transcript_26041/m.57532 type:complete len:276 (-) Transcript_26041:736-1563(-)
MLLGGIELVHSILGKLKQLQRSPILRCLAYVGLVLLLPLLCGLSNRLIQILDLDIQILDLGGGLFNGLFVSFDISLQSFDVSRHILEFVLNVVELFPAILLRLDVFVHFNVQFLHHIVDHLEHLIEALFLALHRQQHQIHVDTTNATQDLSCALPQLARVCGNLQQGWAGKSLFEQLQSVVTVQDLDCFSNCQKLPCLSFFDLSVVLTVLVTILTELLQVLFVFSQRPGSGLQIILIRSNLDSQFSMSRGLLLNSNLSSANLRLLGRDQCSVIGN